MKRLELNQELKEKTGTIVKSLNGIKDKDAFIPMAIKEVADLMELEVEKLYKKVQDADAVEKHSLFYYVGADVMEEERIYHVEYLIIKALEIKYNTNLVKVMGFIL